jgi:hypothetical protein
MAAAVSPGYSQQPLPQNDLRITIAPEEPQPADGEGLGDPLLAQSPSVSSQSSGAGRRIKRQRPRSSFDKPDAPVVAGWRSWCGGRAVTLAKGSAAMVTTVGCAALRWANVGRLGNGFSTIGVGVGIQALVSTCVDDKYTSRVQQVSQSVMSASILFLIAQAAANFPVLQTTTYATIGVMLGVNLAVLAKHLIDRRFGLQVDYAPASALKTSGAKFQCLNFSEPAKKTHYYLKVAAAATCLAVGLLCPVSPLVQGLLLWGAGYYVAEPVSQFMLGWVDRRIDAVKANQTEEEMPKSSNWQVFKTVLTTVSYVAIPAILYPYLGWGNNPRTAVRIARLWTIGLGTGLFDGFLYRTQENELRKKNIDQISALKPRIPVEHRAFKVWKAVWPKLIFASVTAFVVSQWVANCISPSDKRTMAAFYTGYSYATAKGFLISRYWDLKTRAAKESVTLGDRIVDGRVVSQIIPRVAFLGVNAIYLYYALTNSIALHSGQDLDTELKALTYTAWLLYGKAMATEFHQTVTDWQGTVFRFPTMLFINSLLTLVPIFEGTQHEQPCLCCP